MVDDIVKFVVGNVYTLARKENRKQNQSFKNNDKYIIFRNKKGDKFVTSSDTSFNLLFKKDSGFTCKWGKTFEEDPTHCPFGPEIADIEITKSCFGPRNKDGVHTPCKFCYKSNSGCGEYMTFETFKNIFGKINQSRVLTQIAFGVDAGCKTNPDVWKIFDYCIKNDVTPNVTVADIEDQETADNLMSRVGAIAVSFYPLTDKNRCYDTIKLLTDTKKKLHRDRVAINIHALVAEETYEYLFELMDDMKNDPRLIGNVNAVVFLSLKQKGRGVHFNRITDEQYKKLVDTGFEKSIPMGFDSCGANKFLKAISDRPLDERNRLESMTESCESTLFSSYFDVNGVFYPCSFMEKEGEWAQGIDVTKIKDFYSEVWHEPRVEKWREAAIKEIRCHGCNKCPYYNV